MSGQIVVWQQPPPADQKEEGETESWKKEVQLCCRLQACGRRLRVMTEVHDTAEAPVLKELTSRLDFSWRGLLTGSAWRERVKEAWTGDLALVFPAPGSPLCSPALLSLAYLRGFLRAAEGALVADVGDLDLALCTPVHVVDDDGGDGDDRLFLMMLRRERSPSPSPSPPPSASRPPPEEWPCSLALDLLQGCDRLGLFSLSDVSREALKGLSRLPDALQVNCLGWVAALPQKPHRVAHSIENSVGHANMHVHSPPQWLWRPPRRNLGPGDLASTFLDLCTGRGVLSDFRGRPGLEPLWDMEHIPQAHAVSRDRLPPAELLGPDLISGCILLQVLIAAGCTDPSSTPEQQAAKIRAVTEDLRACIEDFAAWFRRSKCQRPRVSSPVPPPL